MTLWTPAEHYREASLLLEDDSGGCQQNCPHPACPERAVTMRRALAHAVLATVSPAVHQAAGLLTQVAPDAVTGTQLHEVKLYAAEDAATITAVCLTHEQPWRRVFMDGAAAADVIAAVIGHQAETLTEARP